MPGPKKNTAFTVDVALVDASARPSFRANPTLAAGDVKVVLDEVSLGNITTLPSVLPAAGSNVKVPLSAAEMNGDRAVVQFRDQTVPKEWDDVDIEILTSAINLDDVNTKLDATVSSRAAPGAAMTLTAGERTAVANEVEAQIIDETDSEKVLQAITDKIAAVNPSLAGLTLAAIATQVRTELTVELARLDVAVSTRLAAAGYTAPDNASIATLIARITAARAGYFDNLNSGVPLTAAERAAIVDRLLARNQKGGADGPANQSVAAALAGGFMLIDIAAGVLTVKHGDGTVAFTRNLTRAQLDAIVGSV